MGLDDPVYESGCVAKGLGSCGIISCVGLLICIPRYFLQQLDRQFGDVQIIKGD